MGVCKVFKLISIGLACCDMGILFNCLTEYWRLGCSVYELHNFIFQAFNLSGRHCFLLCCTSVTVRIPIAMSVAVFWVVMPFGL